MLRKLYLVIISGLLFITCACSSDPDSPNYSPRLTRVIDKNIPGQFLVIDDNEYVIGYCYTTPFPRDTTAVR